MESYWEEPDFEGLGQTIKYPHIGYTNSGSTALQIFVEMPLYLLSNLEKVEKTLEEEGPQTPFDREIVEMNRSTEPLSEKINDLMDLYEKRLLYQGELEKN